MSSFNKHFGKHTKKGDGGDERFGNKRMTCDLGHSHRSKLEGAVCAILQWREKAGELTIVQAEDHIYLSRARIHYIADFKCLDSKTQEFFWVEAKGFANDKWPIKLKLYRVYGPGRLEIWKGSHTRPVLDEVVTPAPDLFPEKGEK